LELERRSKLNRIQGGEREKSTFVEKIRGRTINQEKKKGEKKKDTTA